MTRSGEGASGGPPAGPRPGRKAEAGPGRESLRARAAEVVFGHETPAGKTFDVVLIAAIVASVGTVMLESVPGVEEAHGRALRAAEWAFTAIFTVEYALRLWCAPRPLRYATSFFGLVDLGAVLPTYLSLLLPGAQALLVVRSLRLLRIFRVLKLGAYTDQARLLGRALRASRQKITVFLLVVLTLVLILGSLMYLVEGPGSGFDSIPRSVYWAVVTLTTVGYGDIAPRSALGQALAAFVMILGYAIIAVPTGIVTVELGRASREGGPPRACRRCGLEGHDGDARFCRHCGEPLA